MQPMHLNSEAFLIKRLGQEDVLTARKLFQLFHDVFKPENQSVAGESYLNGLLAIPGFTVYVVMHGDNVAGGLTAYELPMWHTESPEMFLYHIAVRPEYQRLGLGRRLLSALQEYCSQAGIGEMFVAAHEEDSHALDFYRDTGGRAEKSFILPMLRIIESAHARRITTCYR